MPTHIASTEDEIVEAVRTARDWKSPLEIVGAGTKQNFGRAVVTMGSVLDVSGLKGIVSYEPEELILTAAPGTPVAEIEAALAQKGQRLGFEPPDHARFPSLGLARAAARAGGTAPAVLNAANEVAVQAFLERRLNFTAIAAVIDKVLQRLDSSPVRALGDVLDADAAARRLGLALIELEPGACK